MYVSDSVRHVKKGKRMENKTFEEFDELLEQGFQIYFTYLENRFLLFKTADNCYTKELIRVGQKNPPRQKTMITSKYLREIYPFMEEIEYKYV